ncbi:hypothetical protein E2C01_090248 [Portunus trituberculatus]|uniref:Uncharacterized protein n=1 Tax=Portunus trituberculatus TaxID=210409 RepID=A0A5B7JKX0_PORTR|nr:hypothetical protein [Portunus trituberculatus]
MDLLPDCCSQNLFGTDGEDESPPEPCFPIRSSPSPSGWRPSTSHPTDKPVPDSHSAKEMHPDLTYYFMSSDAHLDEEGLVARNLPKVLQAASTWTRKTIAKW